jgi:UDP-glucose 4-epimerase
VRSVNILVTGGGGYIGSHCCKNLFEEGYNPICFDNLINGHKENVKWGELIEGDLDNKPQIETAIKKYKIDAVMHFAAYAYVGESIEKPRKYYENNLQNTINLLSVMLNNNIDLFVFSSSCATYGNPNKIPIDEEHPQNPINPYGKSKYMIEEILKDYGRAYRLRFMILRYFNAAGADPAGEIGEDHEPETHLIPLVLRAAYDNNVPVQVFGTDYPTEDGTCIRDFVHVTDLASAHVLAVQKLLCGGSSDFFNLGTGHGYSVMQVIEKAVRVTGRRIPFRTRGRREGDPPLLVASNRKAIEKLGWNPKYQSLEDIIETAWNWHRRVW